MTDTMRNDQSVVTTALVPSITTVAPVSVPTRSISLPKRLVDLAIAIPLAVLTLPVTLILAAVSMLIYSESPFFRQARLGHGGREFGFLKIRTLPRIVPDSADKYQLQQLDIPRFARVLRSHHLDELPQLWLVVAGKMTLVGPRPEMPTLSASFDKAFVAERLAVRPGLTGLWQVSKASRGLIGESPEWDRHYVRNATLRLDLWIMFRTVLMMVGLREVANLSDIPGWTGAAVAN